MFKLTQLISAHQVVLLCSNETAWLFNDCQVFSRPVASCFVTLPVIPKQYSRI